MYAYQRETLEGERREYITPSGFCCYMIYRAIIISSLRDCETEFRKQWRSQTQFGNEGKIGYTEMHGVCTEGHGGWVYWEVGKAGIQYYGCW